MAYKDISFNITPNIGSVIFGMLAVISLLRIIFHIYRHRKRKQRCSICLPASVEYERQKPGPHRTSFTAFSLWYMGFQNSLRDMLYSPVWRITLDNGETFTLESRTYLRNKRWEPGSIHNIYINPEDISDYYDYASIKAYKNRIIKDLLKMGFWTGCLMLSIILQNIPYFLINSENFRHLLEAA